MENDLSPAKKSRLAVWFSPQTYAAIFSRAWRQFPFTVCYIIALGIAVGCWIYPDNTTLPQSVVAGLIPGALLSIAAKQWSDFRGLKYALLLQLCVIGFSLAAVAYIDSLGNYWSEEFSWVYSTGLILLSVASLVAPVAKGMHGKEQRYGYCRKLVIRLMITGLVFLFMMVISMLFSLTLSTLFNFSERLMMAVIIPALAVIPPALYLISDYPAGDGTVEMIPAPGALFDRFCKNVLLPLAAVYAVILYAYGLKMLVEMSLPRTSVSLMVGGLLAAVFVLLFGIQVYRFEPEANPKAAKVAGVAFRWWPAVMLPLLLMMSVAIGYRVWQYGWTAPRLYVALLNVLAYAACIYGLFDKKPRLDLVASAVVSLFVLVSVIPGFNFTAFSVRNMPDKIAEQLKEIGIEDLPVPYEKLCAKLNMISAKKADSIAENIIDLQKEIGPGGIRGIVSGDVPHYYYDFCEKIREAGTGNGLESWTQTDGKNILSPIPQGYSSIQYISDVANSDNTRYLGKDSIHVRIDSTLTLAFSLNPLVKTRDNPSALPIQCRVVTAPGDVFMLTGFSLFSVNNIKKEDDFGTFRFNGFYLKK